MIIKTKNHSLKNQRGITLVEIMASLGIMTAVFVGIAQITKQSTDDTKASVTALHLKTVGEAANKYIKENYVALLGQAPYSLSVATIAGAGLLPAGYSEINPMSQTTCVKVMKDTHNRLYGMVVTHGGKAVDDLSLGKIASEVGAAGGGIYSAAYPAGGGKFVGAMGGWSMAFTDISAGGGCGSSLTAGHPVMALWFADGDDVAEAVLYRNKMPGNPSLNTMQTPILMGAGTVVTKGSACSTGGALAKDSTDMFMVCRNGVWKPGGGGLNWKGTKATYAALPATADPGDTWRITGLANQAFTWDDENKKWEGLAVNADGSLSLLSTIETKSGKLQVVNASGAVLMEVDGVGLKTKGEVVADGRIRTKEYLELGGTVVADTACGAGVAAGTVAKDAQGLILSCQSGSWKKISGSSGLRSIYVKSGFGGCAEGYYFVGEWDMDSGGGYDHNNNYLGSGAITLCALDS